jgi:hypothetical protein
MKPITLEELYKGVGYIGDVENLDKILNSEPKKEWLKEHPQVRGFMYLPIEKVEFLLSRLFNNVKIEIRSVISSDIRAVVTVRVNYGNGMFHDGVGAAQISKTQPAEMAFPLAKSLALKDGIEFAGKIFGKDLNRNDVSIVTTPVIDESIFEKHQFGLSECQSLEAVNTYFTINKVGLSKQDEAKLKSLCTKRTVQING